MLVLDLTSLSTNHCWYEAVTTLPGEIKIQGSEKKLVNYSFNMSEWDLGFH